jgi:exopolyphosphatase/pppGpp-phosphohydrolase
LVDLPTLPPGQEATLQTVLRLAQTCEFELNHTYQVTHLAARLFDELACLHHLSEKERTWLVYAALLHDIGWIEGWQDHHKVSLRIILTTPMLVFSNKERLIIGSVARYHRKSLPDRKHDHYAALTQDERQVVDRLASCLRLADALDRSHQQRVQDLRCKITAKKIVVCCSVQAPAPEELSTALQKCDLLVLTFHRKVLIEGLV